MADFTMKLISETLKQGEQLGCLGRHSAVFVLSGNLSLPDESIAAGQGGYLDGSANPAVVAKSESKFLRFVVDPDPGVGSPSANGQTILESQFEPLLGAQFLRLDQVAFPPGARAYRHVHPGAGIRYLTKGALEIQSDHGVELMSAETAWFEDANSAVQATASADQSSAFVRAMVLPIEYLGKPTITYLNRSDDDKPRLQTNTRFFDQQIEF
ncbi:MAG: hypothetical protein ABJH63_08760 [Rhizobiaceae bacterium]